ncbi:MAG TPA: alkaline phosphatase family protein [Bacteroidetes bacterium]|nr:alkaline phosphatase family protein [Bacteroidota bacterium]
MNLLKKYFGTLLLLALLSGTLFSFAGCDKTQKKEEDSQAGKPYVVMLSLDGFRWDYTQHAHTPVLDSLKKAGVFAEMIPSFPTKTFPNHYTMATGLYPDHHGIVLNSFYATDLGMHYSISDRASVGNGIFYGGEPIWVTAKKQGVRTATLFWVGSEAAIEGIRPDIWYPYNHTLPFTSRIDSLVRWLSFPDSIRPHLILWYYPEPDGYGHRYGPGSPQVKAMVEQLDQWLGQFFTAMRKLPVFSKLNFIVTSDHGMGPIADSRQVILDKYIDTANLTYRDGGNPVYNLGVKPGKLQTVYENLKKAPHIKVWKHDSLPARLHYGTNVRTHDLTVVADSNWSIYWSWHIGHGNGTHGYDNQWRAMHAIFYAAGPAFKKGYAQKSFGNVDIYPLIAKILGITPQQTDGNTEAVKGMLK